MDAPRPNPSARPSRLRRLPAAASLVVAVAVLVAACGGGGGTSGAPTPASPAAERGLDLADSNGCQACHTANGTSSTGPTWKDLAGSKVELDGGRAVVADDDYLARSITDPKDEVVAGYAGIMPSNDLTEQEVADVIAYLHDLSTKDDGTS